jgi:hypothetical protein
MLKTKKHLYISLKSVTFAVGMTELPEDRSSELFIQGYKKRCTYSLERMHPSMLTKKYKYERYCKYTKRESNKKINLVNWC